MADNDGRWELRQRILPDHFKLFGGEVRPYRYDGLLVAEDEAGKVKCREKRDKVEHVAQDSAWSSDEHFGRRLLWPRDQHRKTRRGRRGEEQVVEAEPSRS